MDARMDVDLKSEDAANKQSSKYVVKCNCINTHSNSGGSSDSESASSNESSSRKCCLKQRLSSIFNNKYLSDVVFIVGESEEVERIPAHKLLLCVGSDVFKTMFSEKWSAESPEIKVPDVEPFAFSALLSFLYMDEVELTSDTVTAILYAARKYSVQPLEDRCVDFLIENLCPSNAFSVLNECRLLDIQKLIKSCLEVIDDDTVTAVATDAFFDIDIETLCLVLNRNTLTINEVQLFEAVLKWSEVECIRKKLTINKENQRSVLEKALPLIRIPLMSVQEFSLKVASSGLFSNDELLLVYQYFSTKPKPAINFSSTPRLSNRVMIVNRFKDFGTAFITGGLTGKTVDSINFTCDHDLELLGYGLHGSSSDTAATKYEVRLVLTETVANAVLHDETTDFICEGTSMTYRALFKSPVKLTALTKYTASVYIKGPNCFTGKKGLKEITKDLPRGQKVTISFSSHNTANATPLTNVDKGLIPELIFII